MPRGETLVLLQNYGTDQEVQLVEGKGALRILWLLGGMYVALGWLSYLPSILFDAIYRVVVRYRYRLFTKKVSITTEPDRFLP